jgi:putative ABC transport system permease protein
MPIDAWRQDLTYSLRFLRRNAGFSATVAQTFGLGVCATAAIVTVVSGVLLRPLPFPEPDRHVSP